jgi:ribosomal RNA-processing protein 17
LAERAAQNAAEVEAAYGGRIDGLGDDAEDWQGISTEERDREEEYEDEEQLATVTIVEDFDPTELIHGPPPELPKSILSETTLKRTSSTPSTKNLSNKRTSKKIHYETKAARSAEKKKQRNRKLEKAAHARGKDNGRFKVKGKKKS